MSRVWDETEFGSNYPVEFGTWDMAKKFKRSLFVSIYPFMYDYLWSYRYVIFLYLWMVLPKLICKKLYSIGLKTNKLYTN